MAFLTEVDDYFPGCGTMVVLHLSTGRRSSGALAPGEAAQDEAVSYCVSPRHESAPPQRRLSRSKLALAIRRMQWLPQRNDPDMLGPGGFRGKMTDLSKEL
ncbi:MAG: hypothetical protein Q8S20_19215 [Sulfuritalea sp.]|nr:hypothetical protein [Sulfuritalea sp.]